MSRDSSGNKMRKLDKGSPGLQIHSFHAIYDFGDWTIFKKCGEKITLLSGTGGSEIFHDFLGLYIRPSFGLHLGLLDNLDFAN